MSLPSLTISFFNVVLHLCEVNERPDNFVWRRGDPGVFLLQRQRLHFPPNTDILTFVNHEAETEENFDAFSRRLQLLPPKCWGMSCCSMTVFFFVVVTPFRKVQQRLHEEAEEPGSVFAYLKQHLRFSSYSRTSIDQRHSTYSIVNFMRKDPWKDPLMPKSSESSIWP